MEKKKFLLSVSLLLVFTLAIQPLYADLNSDLIEAARTGNTAKVKKLLRRGADPNAKDGQGRTLLKIAIAGGHTEIVKLLLEAGAKAGDKDAVLKAAEGAAEHKTAINLLRAAKAGDTAGVKQSLEKGADANAKYGSAQTTALIAAARGGHTETVKALIEAGAGLEVKDKYGRTALMYAAEKGQTESVKALIAGGADVSARKDSGETALTMAADRQHIDTIKALIEGGADPEDKDKYGNSAVSQAALRGHAEVLKVLASGMRRADLNAEIQGGRTLLSMAASQGKTDIVKALIEAGADINAKDKYSDTALQSAAVAGHAETVKALIDAGADINAKDKNGSTALCSAAVLGQAETVKALIEAGADVNANNKEGSTALEEAASRGYIEVVKLLIEAGADVNAADGYYTALGGAIVHNQTKTVKLLLEAGARARVSERAREKMIQGQAAVEAAQKPADLQEAIWAYRDAADSAPGWAAAHYNLGRVCELARKYKCAVVSLERYVLLAPQAEDAREVQKDIYRLQILRDQVGDLPELAGTWKSGGKVSIDGWRFEATVPSSLGCSLRFRGIVTGSSIEGTVYIAACRDRKSTCLFPPEQSPFAGTISRGGKFLALRYEGTSYKYQYRGGLVGLISSDRCVSITPLSREPQEYNLWR